MIYAKAEDKDAVMESVLLDIADEDVQDVQEVFNTINEEEVNIAMDVAESYHELVCDYQDILASMAK